MEKPLSIVGIDPGTTTGFAVIDLSGRCLKIFSSKDLPLSKMITEIIAVSQPIITSTDKEKVPSFVADFSSSLGTLLISPKEDLKKELKKELVHKQTFDDDHQMDSLAAAIYALKRTRHTITKMTRFIKEHKLEKEQLLFARLVLKERVNLQQAKEIIKEPIQKSTVEKVLQEDRITKKDYFLVLEKLQQEKHLRRIREKKYNKLLQEKKMLKQTNILLAKRLNSSDSKIDKLLSFKEKRIKDLSDSLEKEKRKIKELRERISSQVEFTHQIPGNILAKKIPDLGKDNLKNIDSEFLFIERPEIFSEKVLGLISAKGIILLSRKRFSSKISKTCRTYQVEKTEAENEHFCLIKELPAEKQINENNLSEIIDEYKKRKT
jgi:predicted RNase H-like nuclease (RuvC/YqgF family)